MYSIKGMFARGSRHCQNCKHWCGARRETRHTLGRSTVKGLNRVSKESANICMTGQGSLPEVHSVEHTTACRGSSCSSSPDFCLAAAAAALFSLGAMRTAIPRKVFFRRLPVRKLYRTVPKGRAAALEPGLGGLWKRTSVRALPDVDACTILRPPMEV